MISSVLLENKTANGVFEACKVLNQIFPFLIAEVREGRSATYIDQLARILCKKYGVEPAFLGLYDFPAAICISVNNELAHGVPLPTRIFKRGDLVKLDFGVKKDGYYSDCARSITVGKGKKGDKLAKTVKKIFNAGLKAAWPGVDSTAITVLMMMKAEEEGVHIFPGFCGHTIGTSLHDGKIIPNAGKVTDKEKFILQEGDLICIEPIIGEKQAPIYLRKEDRFTFLTDEDNMTAHYENTILITKEGPIILTEFNLLDK